MTNWREVRDKLAGDWFKDWDDRLNHEELRPFFSAYRHEREEATRHFNAGWSAAIEHDPRVKALVEALKFYAHASSSERVVDGNLAGKALADWEEK